MSEWYSKWMPYTDLSMGGRELDFRDPSAMATLCVETKAVSDVRNLAAAITDPRVSPRHYIVGGRGLGKSTLLGLIEYELCKNFVKLRVLPVSVPVTGEGKTPHEIDLTMSQSLLAGLLRSPRDIGRLVHDLPNDMRPPLEALNQADEEYRKHLQNHGSVDVRYLSTALARRLEVLSETFNRIVFLVDGLDKLGPDVVLAYLMERQEYFNNLISLFHCHFIVSAEPSWLQTLQTIQYSGIKGNHIEANPWTADQIKLLLERRLSYLQFYFPLPLTDEAIQALTKKFDGNPRRILDAASNIMNFAARARLNQIGTGMVEHFIWDSGAREGLLLQLRTESVALRAFEKLKNARIASSNTRHTILVVAYEEKRISKQLEYQQRAAKGITSTDEDYRENIEYLVIKDVLRPIPSTKVYFRLDSDIVSLFDFITKDLRQALGYLPTVLRELEPHLSEISAPVEKVDAEEIRDFLRKIFDRSPSLWVNAQNLTDEFLSDESLHSRAVATFGTQPESRLKREIEKSLREMESERALHMTRNGATPLFRRRQIEQDLNPITDTKVIDLLEAAFDEIKLEEETDYDALHNYCNEAYLLTISRAIIASGSEVEPFDAKNVKKILRQIGIETAGAIPFEVFIRQLRITPDSTEGATILLQTTLRYLKEICKGLARMPITPKTRGKQVLDQIFIGINQRTRADATISRYLSCLSGEIVAVLTYIDESTFEYLDVIPKDVVLRIFTSRIDGEIERVRRKAQVMSSTIKGGLQLRTLILEASDRSGNPIELGKLHQRWIACSGRVKFGGHETTGAVIDFGTDLKRGAIANSEHVISLISGSEDYFSKFNDYWGRTSEDWKRITGKDFKLGQVFPMS